MKTYAIVGDGAAGTTAAFYIRRHDPEGRIAIYSEESTPAYYRAALTNYLMGELRAEQLFAVPPNFYNEFNVGRVLTRVVGVDSRDGQLHLSNGESHPYDELLIATGSRARPPSLPGAEIPGVMTMRTMQDARFIMDLVQSGHLRKAVVVGGGILGLELVAGLRSRGVDVTYVIRGDHFMPNVLDRIASDIVLTRCRHFGVDIRTDEEIAEAYPNDDGYLWGTRLKNAGETIEAQLMVVAIGITPNVEFLQGSGIDVDRGVPVDERMRTNVSNVYAGGDVAQVTDRFTKRSVTIGLWEPSRHHGRTAGINMAGGSETWRLSSHYTATRLYDLDVAAIGRTLEGPSDETVVDFPEAGRRIVYRKLVFEKDRLVGALLLGERREKVRLRARLLRKLIDGEVDVASVKQVLLDPLFDVNAWMDSLRAPEAPEPAPSRKSKTDVSRIMGRPSAPVSPTPAAPQERPEPTERPTQMQSLSALMRSPVRGATGTAAPESPGPSRPEGAPPIGVATLKFHGGEVFSLGHGTTTIGRGPANDLVIDDPLVSTAHAEIRPAEDGLVVADLHSTNGTFVNEALIGAGHTLRHGDVIRVGNTSLTFYNQVLAPRAETGPAGLPDEPLDHVTLSPTRFATVHGPAGTFEITEDVAKIGRGEDVQIVISDPAVSWLHAEISRHEDAAYLRDLGSRNGTFVNGELVSVPRSLADGDVIHLGNTDLTFAGGGGTERFATPQPSPDESRALVPGLVGKEGPTLGVTFALFERPVTIGRDPESTISLHDLTVSRKHAVLEGSNGTWAVRDLKSTNGTFVDGARVEKVAPLEPGAEVRFGRAAFEFTMIPAGEPTAAPERREPVPADVAGATRIIDVPAVPTEPSVGRLEVTGGPAAGRVIDIETSVVLGRESTGEVLGLEDRFVSGRHLELSRKEDGALQVVDVGSTNGTWLNDVKLEPGVHYPVVPGDRLRLGPQTTMEAKE